MATLDNEAIIHIQEHLGIFQYKSFFALMPYLENALDSEGSAEVKTCPQCQNFYAIALLHGAGVPVNKAKGIELLTKAANQGYAKAQYNLARMYEDGNGVDVNYEKAYKYCKASAEQGWTDAINRISRMEQKYQSARILETTENKFRTSK